MQAGAAVDLAKLAAWMEAQGLSDGPIHDAALLAGGSQNLIVRFRKGDGDYVLRRPPPTPRPESNETMRREARVLQALSGSGVPHPRVLAACADESVFGFAFYLMEMVEGFNATTAPLPAPHAHDAAMRRRMGFAMVDAAAALGKVDYVGAGLGDFGRPENFLVRQRGRWRRQLESYAAFEGWPGASGLPGVDAVGDYLDANVPGDFTPGVIHGDFSLGNVLFQRDAPELAAIVDWELCTIGDPMIDLGWLLSSWRGDPAGDEGVFVVEPWDGFPTAEELVTRYAEQSGRDMRDLAWYAILACYKKAIILEGSFARACAGRDPMDTGVRLHAAARQLLRRALYRVERA